MPRSHAFIVTALLFCQACKTPDGDSGQGMGGGAGGTGSATAGVGAIVEVESERMKYAVVTPVDTAVTPTRAAAAVAIFQKLVMSASSSFCRSVS